MTDPSTSNSPRPTQQLQQHAEHTWRWGRRQVLATVSWSRRQPRARLVTLAVATVAALAAAWLALELVMWLLATVAGGDTAPDPPAAHAPPHSSPPPRWMAELQHVGLWHQIGGAVQTYAAAHSGAAGMPTWLLLTFWALLGGVLLLGSWIAPKRFGLATLAWCGWIAATAWVIWTQTPGADPVPAALAAALGVTAAVVPLAAPLVLAVVVLGLVPPIT